MKKPNKPCNEQKEDCLSILDIIRTSGFEHISAECIK